MESNITKAIDGITKRLGGDASSENTTEALDTLLSSLSGSVNSTGETLTSDILGKALFERGEVGDIITSTYYDTINNVQYDNPWRIVSAPREVELKSGGKIMATPLQAKYAQLRNIPFSSKRALIKCPDGLEPGTYNIRFGYNINNTFPKDSYLSFTITKPIPINGKITLMNNFTGPTVGLISFKSNGKTVIEVMFGSSTESGTNLGITGSTADDRNGNINAINEVLNGYNIWRDSAIRQYLNSDAGVGEWWEPQDGWDLVPTSNLMPGYLYELDPEIKSMLKEVKVVTNGNGVSELNPVITYDKVILPGLDDMYIKKQDEQLSEGDPLDYWKELNATNDRYDTYVNYTDLYIDYLTSGNYILLRTPPTPVRYITRIISSYNGNGQVTALTSNVIGKAAPIIYI